MTLKGKGYDLPISLTFYSGDVTCATEASPIGLGWALMAGGVIAATKAIMGTLILLNTYDYGARQYNPVVTRNLSVTLAIISCIRPKFSREFSVSTPNTRKDTAIIEHKCCQSPVSLDTLQKDSKRPQHRGFVSLSVSISKFSDLETKTAD